MIAVNMQFQHRTSEIVQRTDERIQRTDVSIHNMENQIGQLATHMNEMNSKGSDKLPSQTTINPHNVSSITLRSGTQLQAPMRKSTKVDDQLKSSNTSNITTPPTNDDQRRINTRNNDMDAPPRLSHEDDVKGKTVSLDKPSIPLPFLKRVVQTSTNGRG